MRTGKYESKLDSTIGYFDIILREISFRAWANNFILSITAFRLRTRAVPNFRWHMDRWAMCLGFLSIDEKWNHSCGLAADQWSASGSGSLIIMAGGLACSLTGARLIQIIQGTDKKNT